MHNIHTHVDIYIYMYITSEDLNLKGSDCLYECNGAALPTRLAYVSRAKP